MLVGTGAVAAAIISWLLPKISKPTAVPAVTPVAPVTSATLPVAKGAAAVAQATGPIRDYNLAGLAIEELDDYPSQSGVSISGV
jgi:hypothetical protein